MSNQTNYERQTGSGSSKSWSLRFFILAINLLMFFLILQIQVLRTFGMILLGISAFILVFKYINRRKNSNSAEDNPQDLIPLMFKYLKINRKYILASILGLSLAILVVSQIMLLTGGNSSNIYYQALSNGQTPVFEGYMWDTNNIEFNNFTSIRAEIQDKFSNAASEVGIQASEILIDYEYSFSITQADENQYNPTIRSEGITKIQFDLLKDFPNFPAVNWHDNLSVLVIQEWYIIEGILPSNISNENGPTTFIDFYQNEFTIDLDGVWVVDNEDYQYSNENNLGDLFWEIGDSILSPDTIIPNRYSSLSLDVWTHSIRGYIDVSSLTGYNREEVMQKFSFIVDEVYNMIRAELGSAGLDMYSPASNNLQFYEFEAALITILLLIVSLPMLGIALYLVYFSLSLVELRKQNLVAIMKIRGISSGQLQFMMMVESIMSALIASSIGMIISVPWVQYILQSTELYGANSTVNLTPLWFLSVPIIGVILAFDLNIGPILSISSTTVEEGQREEESKEPFWKRLYLDVIFSVIGVSVWLVIRFVSVDNLVYFILLGIGVYTLPFLVIGLPLLVSRYYSSFLTLVSDYLWVKEGNIFALATRNMRNNKFSASKLAVLLMLGMMFSFVALGVPNSFDNWSVESNYYRNGSDFNIENLETTNSTYFEPLDHPDLSAVSMYNVFTTYSEGSIYWQVKILGVDPSTFAETAFWNDDYASEDLEDLMDLIENDKVLMEQNAMDILNQEIGDDFSLFVENDRVNLNIVGNFKYFPMLVDYMYFSENYIDTVHVVMSLDRLEQIHDVGIVNVIAKAKEGTNHSRILNELEIEYSDLGINNIRIDSVQVSLTDFNEDPITRLLYSMFDTLLIITLLTTIIGVGYFSFTTLAERRREIGVFRAVGMVSNQIFMLLVVESVILIVSSMIIGILAGSFIASNLFFVLGGNFGGNIPPIKLMYPPLLTTLFVLGTLVLGVIAAAIPAKATASKQTGSILRAE